MKGREKLTFRYNNIYNVYYKLYSFYITVLEIKTNKKNTKMAASTVDDDYTLVNRRVDGDSSYWKKKYTMLLKKTENTETVSFPIDFILKLLYSLFTFLRF